MAILRRRRLVSFASLGMILLPAAIFSTHCIALSAFIVSKYITHEHTTVANGDEPILKNKAAFDDSFSDNTDVHEYLMERFIRNDHRKDEETSWESVEADMMERKKQLTAVCAIMKDNNVSTPNQWLFQDEDLKRVIVNEENQILFCCLPKVANTNFRRVFLGLQGVVPKSEVPRIAGNDIYWKYNESFKYINSFETWKQSELIQDFRKFIFVRDPLDRLLSGFRNKFLLANKRQTGIYLGRVIRFYKRHPDLRERNNMPQDFKSREITFKEFLIYVTDVFEVKEYLNEHFVPSNQLCNPCKIQYDYIGKYESLDTDVRYVFDQLNIDIEFPGRNDNFSSISTSALVDEFYKPMPDWLLQKTWEIFRFDYFLFSYHLPEWYRIRISTDNII